MRYWTPAEIDTLRRMRLEGSTISEVAIALCRPYLAVVTKSRDLKVSEGFNPPKVKPANYSPRRAISKPPSSAVQASRKCLCCAKQFPSAHKFNRVCMQCSQSQLYR